MKPPIPIAAYRDKNTDVTPAELLDLVRHDIEIGECKPKRMIILVEEENDKTNCIWSYRAGCEKRDELWMLNYTILNNFKKLHEEE